jgi:hypothetical protein
MQPFFVVRFIAVDFGHLWMLIRGYINQMCFAMPGINVDSHNAVAWVTPIFSEPLNSMWLNRKQHASIPHTFDSLVTKIRKTSTLSIIRDDAITAMIGHTQGSMSDSNYTK